jgi:hypothetical protein
MKIAFLFIITLFISIGSLMSGLHSHHPLTHILIGWGIWYVLYLSQRSRIHRRQSYRRRAYLNEMCMRTYLKNNGVRW